MEYKYFSRDGVILPIERAFIPLSSVEYSYGFGVYETIRCSKGIIYFLQNHIDRLITSAKIIGLEHGFSDEFIAHSVHALNEITDATTFNLKILLIGGPTSEKAELVILCLNPLFPDRKLYQEGASVVSVELERPYPHAKSLNMLGSYMAYRDAKEVGAYDALLVDRQGNITEGTRTNFFCIKDDNIFSPPEADILLGVTRRAMIMAAVSHGYSIMHKKISRDEITSYDGAFLTSTSSKIVPIKSVDGIELNAKPPENIRRLMDVFGRFLNESRGKLDASVEHR